MTPHETLQRTLKRNHQPIGRRPGCGGDGMTSNAELKLLHTVGSGIEVTLGDKPLMAYTYNPTDVQFESPRPYVHPVYTLGGDLVSLFRPHDHVWHKGIAWSLPNVGPDNFWGGATYLRDGGYQSLPNNGSMLHTAVVEATVTAAQAVFSHDLLWESQSGAGLISERRTLTVNLSETPGAWVLGWSTSMTNVSEAPIVIGSPTTEGRDNAGYGGLFWRGPRSFTDGTLFSPDGPGGDELRGTRHPWLGLTGQHDDAGGYSSIVMVDSTENPRHPPQWFARSQMFGCLNPAPFFSEEFTLEPAATVDFSYAVVIADGAAEGARANELAAAGQDVLKGQLVHEHA